MSNHLFHGLSRGLFSTDFYYSTAPVVHYTYEKTIYGKYNDIIGGEKRVETRFEGIRLGKRWEGMGGIRLYRRGNW